MTETIDETTVQDALEFIDGQLAVMHAREIVSAADVSDLLLDLRQLLTAEEAPGAPEAPTPEPATA